jgi:nucleotide-binding universal stress UspA family protein
MTVNVHDGRWRLSVTNQSIAKGEYAMAIRQVLVPVCDAADAAQLITAACAVISRTKARAIVANGLGLVVPGPDQEYFMSAAYFGKLIARVEKAQRAVTRTIRRQCQTIAKETGIALSETALTDRPTMWIQDGLGDPLMAAGSLYDLVIARRPMRSGTLEQGIVEDALFDAHQPTLLLPPKAPRLDKGSAVAWNGSREAAQALERAVDLMDHNAPVIILQVGDLKAGAIPPLEAMAYLESHGFKAFVKHLADKPGKTTDILLSEARKSGAGILVAGAYSHSRTREAILGGVTASLFTKAHLPVFFAR